MKVNSIVFATSLPEVSFREGIVKVEWGVIVMEMTPTEAASLMTNLLVMVPIRKLLPGVIE